MARWIALARLTADSVDMRMHRSQARSRSRESIRLPSLQEFIISLAAVPSIRQRRITLAQYDANNASNVINRRQRSQPGWPSDCRPGGDVPARAPEPDRKATGKGTSAANTLFEDAHAMPRHFVAEVDAEGRSPDQRAIANVQASSLGETIRRSAASRRGRAHRSSGRRTPGVGKPEGEVLPTPLG